MGGITGTTGEAIVGGGRFKTTVSAATTVVKAGAGRAFRVIVTAGTGSVTVADSATDTSSGVIWTKATVAVGDIYPLDCPTTVGIAVTAAAATTVVVIWS